MMMILLGCFAGCAGSTGGGIKMVRMLLLVKQAWHELGAHRAPARGAAGHAGRRRGAATVMASVMAFMLVYGATLASLTLVLLFTGLEPITAATAVIASVNNIGPGLGDVGPSVNFKGLTDFQTWVCTVGDAARAARAAVRPGAVHAAVLEEVTAPSSLRSRPPRGRTPADRQTSGAGGHLLG